VSSVFVFYGHISSLLQTDDMLTMNVVATACCGHGGGHVAMVMTSTGAAGEVGAGDVILHWCCCHGQRPVCTAAR